MATDYGMATTITFASSSFSAEVTNIDGPSMTREEADTTHMGTTVARTHIPFDLYDGGEVTIDYHFDGTQVLPTLIAAVAETVTIDFGAEGVNNKYAFSAFATACSPSAPMDDLMVSAVTLKVSGAVTIS